MNKKFFKKIFIIMLLLLSFNLICHISYAASTDPFKAPTAEDEEEDTGYNRNEEKEEEAKEVKKEGLEIVKIIRKAVAKWYYIMRLIVIAFMLLVLMFLGIKLAISSIASDKALYKSMLVDWVVGMILVFSIHYIMIFIFMVNDSIVQTMKDIINKPFPIQEEYQYGDDSYKIERTTKELATTLYETARTKTYSLNIVDGFVGTIIYAALVYYAWRFALKYLIRLFNIIVLILLAPFVSGTYALNKIMTGKSKIWSAWLKEFIMCVALQSSNVIIYTVFSSVSLQIALISLPGAVLTLILFSFMLKSDKLLRELFNMSGGNGGLAGDMDSKGFNEMKNDALAAAMVVTSDTSKGLMKSGLSLATKSAKTVGGVAAGMAMKGLANSGVYDKYSQQKEQKENEEKESELERYKSEDEEYQKMKKELDRKKAEYSQKQAALEQKRKEIEDNIESKKRKQKRRHSNGSKKRKLSKKEQAERQASIKKLEDELKLVETEESKLSEDFVKNLSLEKKVKEREDQIKEKFSKDYVEYKMNTQSTFGNVMDGLNPYNYVSYDPKKGKYVYNKNAGKKLAENMKMSNLLGMTDAEKKLLESEVQTFKSAITGFFSGVAGTTLVGAHPLLGMALLTKGVSTSLAMSGKRRSLKNNPKFATSKRYQCKGFSGATVRRLRYFETLTAEELIELDAIHHDKIQNEAKKVRRKQLKNAKKTTIHQYRQASNVFANNILDSVQNESTQELAVRDKLNSDGTIRVKDTIIEINSGEENDVNKTLDEITRDSELTDEQKTEKIKTVLMKNQTELIEKNIVKLAAEKGVTDIDELELSAAEMTQVRTGIISSVEKSGFVKKGEITLENLEITNKTVQNVIESMSSKKEETNQRMEQQIVDDACLEYMEKNNITDVKKLKEEDTKQEIYDIIKDKMMPESSKQSASVIDQIKGNNGEQTNSSEQTNNGEQGSIRDEFQLSAGIINIVDVISKRVKKTNISEIKDTITEEDKVVLQEREVTRKMNEAKDDLERMVSSEEMIDFEDTDTLSQEDEEQLKLLFLLSEINSQNEELDKVGVKTGVEEKRNQLIDLINSISVGKGGGNSYNENE